MGSQVTAICECGLEEEILVGGGMMDFMRTCFFPCYCARCKTVVQVNMLTKRNRCPTCGSGVIPYDDPTLSEKAGERMIASWNVEDRLGRELILTDTNYRCPQCGKMSLRFEAGLCYD